MVKSYRAFVFGFIIILSLCIITACGKGDDSKSDINQNSSSAIFPVRVPLAVGYYHTCAIDKTGLVHHWSDTKEYGFVDRAVIKDAVFVAAHESECCAVLKNGNLVCQDTFPVKYPLKDPPDLGPIRAIGFSFYARCAIRADETVRCWGDKFSSDIVNVPHDLGKVDHLQYYADTVCALKKDQTLRCWGRHTAGDMKVPDDLGPILSFGLGSQHACALKIDNTVQCWGTNIYGELNIPSTLKFVKKLVVGNTFNIALDESGVTHTWGNSKLYKKMYKDLYPSLLEFPYLSAAISHVCGMSSDHKIKCSYIHTQFSYPVPSVFAE